MTFHDYLLHTNSCHGLIFIVFISNENYQMILIYTLISLERICISNKRKNTLLNLMSNLI